MFGEYDIVLMCRSVGLLGVAVFVGTYALLMLRVLDGGSVAFFAGNTAAAALVLASNLAGFHVAWLLMQILIIAAALTMMIALFFDQHEI